MNKETTEANPLGQLMHRVGNPIGSISRWLVRLKANDSLRPKVINFAKSDLQSIMQAIDEVGQHLQEYNNQELSQLFIEFKQSLQNIDHDITEDNFDAFLEKFGPLFEIYQKIRDLAKSLAPDKYQPYGG